MRQQQHFGYTDQLRSMDNTDFHWAIEDPQLGILELTCENGYIVTQYDLGSPQVRELTYDRPLNDGTIDRSLYTGARLVSLTIALNGPNAILRSQLAAYLHPRRRPVLSFVEKDWPVRRQVRTRGKGGKSAVSQRNMNTMQANFVVPDGMIESYEVHYENVGVSGDNFVNKATLFNAGDVDAHWMVDVKNIELSASGGAQGSGLELVLDPEAGVGGPFDPGTRSIKMILDIDSNERLVVSSIDKSAVIVTPDGRTRTAFQFIDKGSDWWQLPPGEHTFGFWTLDENGNRIAPKQEMAAVWDGVGVDGETVGEENGRDEYQALTIESGASGAAKAYERIMAFMNSDDNDSVVPNPGDQPSKVGDVLSLFASGVNDRVWVENAGSGSLSLTKIDPTWTGYPAIQGCKLLAGKPSGFMNPGIWQSSRTAKTTSVWTLVGQDGGASSNLSGYSAIYWRDTWFS